ncbi:hypothetical protein [Flavobacterium sp.]|uniref:hypothetical protein n=1 Tax=Flavobacterium sp. TaxID=239 RepID=UPI003B9AAB6B
MEVHLKIIGLLFIALAWVHIIFPKYFNWKEDLKPLSLINRQMMIVHTFFIALVVFLIGLLCVVASKELINTKLGHVICLGLGVFWTCRLFIQFFVYSSALWKGKTFETAVHVVFSVLWAYSSIIFLVVALG